MTWKKSYNLKNQRISRYPDDDLLRACVCVFLAIFTISGIALAAVYIVKSSKGEKNGETYHQNSGDWDTLQSNDSHTSTRKESVVTIDDGITVTTSNTIEYTSIEFSIYGTQ